jgi:hypothetical protein
LIIDEVNHLDTLTYERLQWLAKLMTDAASKDKVKAYFVESVHVGEKSYDDVAARLIDIATRFEAKHKSGKLHLDLDLEPVLAARPTPADMVARKPGAK